jgi:uncharacterized membrane protein YidH (DUF202 family)
VERAAGAVERGHAATKRALAAAWARHAYSLFLFGCGVVLGIAGAGGLLFLGEHAVADGLENLSAVIAGFVALLLLIGIPSILFERWEERRDKKRQVGVSDDTRGYEQSAAALERIYDDAPAIALSRHEWAMIIDVLADEQERLEREVDDPPFVYADRTHLRQLRYTIDDELNLGV